MSPLPTRYDLLYLAATPAIVPYLAARRLRKGKSPESRAGMLGRRLPRGAAADVFRNGSLWLHAVSFGEVNAARAVAPHLRQIEQLARLPLVISTVTETGQAQAARHFPDVAALTFWPADFSANVRRFQSVFNPSVFILLETELWPNFLMLARQRQTRCFMLNAKLSDRSAPRYRKFQGLLRPALDALSGICAQTEEDAIRFAALGIPAERIAVTGNCKFDLPAPRLSPEERQAWLEQLGADTGRRWIVAGSTHPGEEELILGVFKALTVRFPELGLILCPRHPERFEAVARLVAGTGLRWRRASTLATGDHDPAIMLLDQMGVLARAYGLGEVAVMGGSFAPIGGHNLLEAAAHRIPVVHGPHMHAQRDIMRIFRQTGAGSPCSAETLAATLELLLTDGAQWNVAADRALTAAQANLGSARRAAEQVAAWLG